MSATRDRVRPYVGALRRACEAMANDETLQLDIAINRALIAEGFTLHTVPIDIRRGIVLASFRIQTGTGVHSHRPKN